MKYVFIVNPNSGKSNLKDELLQQLKNKKNCIDYEIVNSTSREMAMETVDKYCNDNSEDIVFCACGGDGTLNAVVSSAIKYKNAVVTCFPCGSGNDFVKVYGGKENFLNINNLINGIEIKIDVMQVNDKYSVNVTNFGFDAAVCDIANKVRRKFLIGGKRSYTTGIIKAIFTARKNKCKVIADGEILASNKILLSTISNGKYVGGAYLCAPNSNNEDGLLEVSVVRPITLFKFIQMLKPYKLGKQLEDPRFNKYITYRRCKRVEIFAPDNFKICLDGEIYTGPYFYIENKQQALRFIKPNSQE